MHSKTIYHRLSLAGLALAFSSPSFADLTTVPATIDPGRIVQRYLAPPPSIKPSAKPVTEVEARKTTKKITSFRLKHVVVQGNTIFTTAELDTIFQNKIGKRITPKDLQEIADTIVQKYNQKGYVLADVDFSRSKKTLIVHVYEGYVDQVNVHGTNISASTANQIQSYGNRIKKQNPLQMNTLVRYTLLTNDLPGISAQGVLTPSATKPDATDLTYAVNRKPYNAYISYDNRGTRALGPQEFLFGAYANSWWGGNQTGLQGTVTQETNELKYLEVSHQQYIGDDGMNLYVHADGTNTRPGSVFDMYDFKGRSRWVGATLSYPWMRSAEKSVFVHGTLDALNSTVDEGLINSRLFYDRVRSLRVGATLDCSDKWNGHNLLDAEVSKGLNGLGADDSFPSVPNGEADYTKLNLSVSRWQPLPNHFSVFAAVRGQYTGDTLLSSEQIGFGGTVYGRGYDPSEIVGDKGIEGKVELRYEPYALYPKLKLDYLQVYALYDAGVMWNYNPTQTFIINPSTVSVSGGRLSATSTGLGVRFDITKHLSGNLELDFPLTRNVLLEGNKDPRGYFGLTAYL